MRLVLRPTTLIARLVRCRRLQLMQSKQNLPSKKVITTLYNCTIVYDVTVTVLAQVDCPPLQQSDCNTYYLP